MGVQFWDDVVLFDSGNVAMHGDCCCGCPHCSGDTPSVLRLTFDGVVEGNCGDCNDFNNSFDLDRDVPTVCTWRTLHAICVSEGDATISIQLTSVLILVHVFYGLAEDPNRVQFAKVVEAPYDCTNLGAIPLTDPGANTPCNWTNATCTVSVPPPGVMRLRLVDEIDHLLAIESPTKADEQRVICLSQQLECLETRKGREKD